MTTALAPHSLALMGVDDTLDSLGPYRLICRCGYETEDLFTIADVEAAALTHKREVMGTTVRAE